MLSDLLERTRACASADLQLSDDDQRQRGDVHKKRVDHAGDGQPGQA